MIEIVFISSSRTKFAHIEYGFRGSRYHIVPQKNYGIGYIEPRIYDRSQLLKESYVDARKRFEKSVHNSDDKFFILEDTSVRIEALSSEKEEVPGLDIKYWMQDKRFEDVDALLKARNNQRACTVRSDIVLHLPKQLREKYQKEFMVFTGEQEGYICKEEKRFKTNPLYPWLDNKTFNKWFVPSGYESQDMVISLLDIKEANRYDFRLKALNKLISFLDKEDLKSFEKQIKSISTPSLFISPTFVFVGSTCAGKSTMAQYLAENYGYFHIEASDFMYMEYYKMHGYDSGVKIGDFAQKILKEQPTIVAKSVVDFCNSLKDVSIVVSGFRAQEEVDFFQKNHKRNIQVIYIDTDQRIRYERCAKRGRGDAAETFEKFREKDTQQYAMGIDKLEKNTIKKLTNNDPKYRYFQEFEEHYSKHIGGLSMPVRDKDIENMRLEESIIFALYANRDDYYTTTEIASLINRDVLPNKPKNKNNVSRYFNQKVYPFYEASVENGVNKYRLNTTGLSQGGYLFQRYNVQQ